MPRESIITQELINEICEHVANGVSTKMSAAAAGINQTTVYLWRKKGRELEANPKKNPTRADKLYIVFSNSLLRARGEAVTKLKKVVVTAAIDSLDWRAAMALGKSMYADEFGADRIEVTGKDGGPLEFQPDLDALADVIERTKQPTDE